MNNPEVIQSLQEGICRRYVNTILVLHKRLYLPHSNFVIFMGSPRTNSHFPNAEFQPPPQSTSSHHHDGGASLDATSRLCLVSLPTHPGWKGQRASYHPTQGPVTKIPLCNTQQQLGLMIIMCSADDVCVPFFTLEHSLHFLQQAKPCQAETEPPGPGKPQKGKDSPTSAGDRD